MTLISLQIRGCSGNDPSRTLHRDLVNSSKHRLKLTFQYSLVAIPIPIARRTHYPMHRRLLGKQKTNLVLPSQKLTSFPRL